MLRTIKQIQGGKLGATDGEIGHVKDFYFDDVNWVVRYVVADTGSWMDAPAPRKTADAHLRSAETIIGYKIQADAELAGYVEDFVLDDKSWAIRQLVVDVGSWLSNRKVLISSGEIERISWDESKVIVKLTKEAVLGSRNFDPASFGIRQHDPRIFQ